MRAIPNLLEEAEVLHVQVPEGWQQVWAAEVIGRAIGHEVRYLLEANEAGITLGFRDMIDPDLPMRLVQHHIADVL